MAASSSSLSSSLSSGNFEKQLCSNCEKQEAKLYCRECLKSGADDHLFCLGCSLIHPQVKGFKSHNVVAISDSVEYVNSREKIQIDYQFDPLALIDIFVFDYCGYFLEPLFSQYEMRVGDGDMRGYGSIILCFVVYYAAIKVFLGRLASFANCIVIIIIFRWLQKKRGEDSIKTIKVDDKNGSKSANSNSSYNSKGNNSNNNNNKSNGKLKEALPDELRIKAETLAASSMASSSFSKQQQLKKKKIVFSDKSIPDLDDNDDLSQLRFKDNKNNNMNNSSSASGGNSNSNSNRNSHNVQGDDRGDENFENEFWHSTVSGSGQATLRRRVRAYEPRQQKKRDATTASNGDDVEKESSKGAKGAKKDAFQEELANIGLDEREKAASASEAMAP